MLPLICCAKCMRLPLPKASFVTAREAILSPRTGCDGEGEGCGERTEGSKEGGGALKPSILSLKCEAWPAGWGFRRRSVLLS